jgi:hypothetical protein
MAVTRTVLRQGQPHEVLFDDIDVPIWDGRTWSLTSSNGSGFYAHTSDGRSGGVRQPDLKFHRLVMGCTFGDGMVVDHLNHNTLDNRRHNLRVVTQIENLQNQAGHRDRKYSSEVGVSYNKRNGRWRAAVRIRGETTQTWHKTEAEAILAARAMRVGRLQTTTTP